MITHLYLFLTVVGVCEWVRSVNGVVVPKLVGHKLTMVFILVHL
jgi:hypothetical protein